MASAPSATARATTPTARAATPSASAATPTARAATPSSRSLVFGTYNISANRDAMFSGPAGKGFVAKLRNDIQHLVTVTWAGRPPTLPPPRADHYILQEAWAHATELSEAAGFQYKDRDGNIRFPRQDDTGIAGQVLHRWCDKKGITYE